MAHFLLHRIRCSHIVAMMSASGTKSYSTICTNVNNLFSVLAASNPKLNHEVLFGIILEK
jgi:hypothetical protein